MTQVMMKNPTFWYVYPRDAVANQTFSRYLDPDDFCADKICSDGKKRNLWRCSSQKIGEFERCANDLNLRFQIFVREGMHGKIRPWLFSSLRRKQRRATVA